MGNRPTTYFNKEGWLNIGKKFQELTGREYERLKFKNKWDQLKREWKIWKELKRGCTGLGWDPIKRTIDAPDEWWAKKLEAMPQAKKYKQCGIDPDFEEKLDIMFVGVVATGKYVANPAEMSFSGVQDNIVSEPLRSDEEIPSEQRDMGESSVHSKRTKGCMKKKETEKDSLVIGQFDKLIEAFRAPPTADSTIVECLRILCSIPEVSADIDFHATCIKRLEDPTRRQIFIALEPELRMAYLCALLSD